MKIKKRILVVFLNLLFFISFFQNVNAVPMPTKKELVKAVMLRLVTNKIRFAEKTGRVLFNLADGNNLDTNYPEWTQFVKDSPQFQSLSEGLEGAQKWTDEGVIYYKKIGEQFLSALLDKDVNVFMGSGFKVGVSIKGNGSFVYTPYCIPANNLVYCDIVLEDGRLLCNMTLNCYNSSQEATTDIGFIWKKYTLACDTLGGHCISGETNPFPNIKYLENENFIYLTNVKYIERGTRIESPYNPIVNIVNSIEIGMADYKDKYITPNFENIKTFDDVEKLPIKDLVKTFDKKDDVKHYLDNAKPTPPSSIPSDDGPGIFKHLFDWFIPNWDIINKSLDFTPVWQKHFKPFYDITNALSNLKVDNKDCSGKFYMIIPKCMGGDGVTLKCVLDYTVGGVYVSWARTFIGWGIWLAFAWWILDQFKPKININ